MKKFKRLIAIVTVLLFALSIIAPAFAQDEATTEETAGSVYDQAAKILQDKGILKGNEQGDLMLDKSLTRAEILAMIIRATGQEDVVNDYVYADVYAEQSFTDVPKDHWAFAYVEAGKDLGIVNGYPSGTFKPDQPVKFEELCKMLVAAKGESPAAGTWPINYVRKALDLGFFNGIEDEVGIGTVVIRGQAAVAFANAFFPPEKTIVVKDVKVLANDTIEVAVDVYLNNEPATLEEGDVIPLDFEIMDASDETKTVAVTLIDTEKSDFGAGKIVLKTAAQTANATYKLYFKGKDTGLKFVAVPVPLQVTKVEALNYAELKVTFNKEVDNTTYATTKTNYTVKVGTATVPVSYVTLASDKKSVTLLLASAFTSTDTVTVTVSKAVGMDADYTTTITNFVDTTAPTVESVTGVGLTKIIVKFSEAVKNADNPANYTVDGAYTPATVQVDDAKRTATLTFYSPLTAGTHTIQFSSNIRDYADYGLVTPIQSVQLSSDSTTVSTPSVVEATQTYVKLKFNKGIIQVTSVSVSPSGAQYTGYSVDANDPTLVELDFATTNPLPASGAVLTLSVVDVTGNSASNLTVTVVPTVDVTRPTYVSYTVDSQNTIRVTFSEDVLPQGTFSLTEPDGEVLNPSSIAYYVDSYGTTYKNQLVLTFPRNIDTGTCTLSISDVKDTSPLANVIVSTNVSISMLDKTAPTVASIVYDTLPISKLYITFSESVDRASALNPSNYTLVYSSGSTSAVSSISTAYLSLLSDGKTVLINFGSSTQSNVTGVMVANVADLAGNKAAAYVTTLKALPTTSPLITSAALTAQNQITLYLDGNYGGKLAYISPADFVIYYNSNDDLSSAADDTVAAYPISVSYDSSANTITLTLSTNLETNAKKKDANGNLKDVYVKLNPSGVVTKDVFDRTITMTASNLVVLDKCAPTVTDVSAGSLGGTIKITFSEPIDGTPNNLWVTLYKDSSVQPYTKISKSADGTVLYVGTSDPNVIGELPAGTYKIVINAGYIKDLAGNTMNYVAPYEGKYITAGSSSSSGGSTQPPASNQPVITAKVKASPVVSTIGIVNVSVANAPADAEKYRVFDTAGSALTDIANIGSDIAMFPYKAPGTQVKVVLYKADGTTVVGEYIVTLVQY
ncbi:Ig-like domain-containing protein [Caldicellulosiruptor sp. DIB 104C]|uniref:Ig-like domain-containing protein n=1 Tax=Caldicellulosiruptor sp. DIB 104C TaxID=3019889 RepID=UPI002305ED0A|nr:Ig-like domain-containing protein [Caldicellulosiruptor sp. DIB 104C]